MNIWIDVAAVASIFAVGNIFFGHFEYGTPKWRRVLKFVILTALTAWIASTGGHAWAAAFVGAMAGLGLIAHFTYLRRHGIDPWTAEPKDKYYALRGWPA
jgi:membrane associated rhomboid family serine protease